MTSPRPFIVWHKTTLALMTGLTMSLGSLSVAYAQAKVQFNVPNIEAPGNRESAAQRSGSESCTTGSSPLMAVVPDTNVGLTTAAYPEFYVYVPPTQAKTAKFVIFDEATNTPIYEETYTLENPEGGIVTVALPNNGIQQPLQVDQAYYWYFSLECDADDPDANPVIESTVQRIETEAALSESAAESDPDDLPALYAEAGIWYDALSASALLSESDTSQVRVPSQQWSELLESVGLGSIADATLLGE